MGRFDQLRPKDLWARGMEILPEPTHAPDDPGDAAAEDPRPAFARPVQLILAIGIDGLGPLSSSAELADAARANNPTTEAAVSEVVRSTIIRGAAGGFVTGAGGFSALAVALPVNVVEFYVQAARMVAAIAILRGHEVDDPRVRKAVLQTLVATQHDSALVEAVAGTRVGALTWRVLRFVPSGVLLFASKGIGFRLLRAVTGVLFGRLGRGLPLVGGAVVGAVDTWNLRRIAAHAKAEFPVADAEAPVSGPSPET